MMGGVYEIGNFDSAEIERPTRSTAQLGKTERDALLRMAVELRKHAARLKSLQSVEGGEV
jgi:hypothetical protein